MPRNHCRARLVESLECRRLLANYVLDVDPSASRISVTATLDGERLDRTGGSGNGRLDGSQNLSVTRRGVELIDNNAAGTGVGSGIGTVNGTGIVITDADGDRLDFEFQSDDGVGVSISGVTIGLDGSRSRLKNNRFSTRSIRATLEDGDLGVTGAAVPADIGGYGGDVNASNGRVSRTSSSRFQVVVPFEFTISRTVNRPGFSSARVQLTFSGKLVGEARGSPVFGDTSIGSPIGTTPGLRVTSAKASDDRVASDVLG